MEEKDITMVAWTFNLQKCGLFITLWYLKMKVVKLIQSRPTPFKDGVLGNP
jgi:hypothetical protein